MSVTHIGLPVRPVQSCQRAVNRELRTHLLGQRAGLLGRVEDFVVEDGEVEGQAQPDGVCWLHVLLADVEGVLVGLLRVLHRVFTAETQQSLTAYCYCVNVHHTGTSSRSWCTSGTTPAQQMAPYMLGYMLANSK